ncbi:IS66 family insertion sequence element accessory protein TnpA [Chondrinema litorale]|uniref:IS66 family insertion sequence element accessory protein TnpA n=1 Tax=Chondrinema litorale TaxID=2994555 RepID=UPI002542CDF7|nr:hypothetical protein [Chondrinema litorale]UZR96346.1 hypothetical protein OQ292_22060 [Chondrinema litorale]UZR96372.1 hypothetical protein OQ292_22200 [Chondrinema litorale]
MYTSKEMFPVVEDWLSSGLTQKAYSLQHNLPLHILPYWVSRYRKRKSESTPKEKSAKFIPVNYEKPMLQGVEIEFPNGIILRFSQAVSASYLQQVLKLCSD